MLLDTIVIKESIQYSNKEDHYWTSTLLVTEKCNN